MNAKLTKVTFVGLTAMIALLAGCTSSPASENEEKPTYPAGCESDVGYSPETGVKCDSTVTTTTTTTTTTVAEDGIFPPAPDGVQILTMQLSNECSVVNGIHIPRGHLPSGHLEWYLNTGEIDVKMAWSYNDMMYVETMNTHGQWERVALGSDAGQFCLRANPSETPPTVALALVLTQYG